MGLVREHAQIPFAPLEVLRVVGEMGRASVRTAGRDRHPGQVGALEARRIRLEPREPTRDGDDTLYLLTMAPAAAVDACTLARLYRERWTLEKAFLHLTPQLRCKIDTLASPPTALFGLAIAVVAYNGLAVITATLR